MFRLDEKTDERARNRAENEMWKGATSKLSYGAVTATG